MCLEKCADLSRLPGPGLLVACRDFPANREPIALLTEAVRRDKIGTQSRAKSRRKAVRQ
jgi:hypothetical protein